MRNLLLAAGSLAVLASAGVVDVAPAADIPVKAPRYVPAVWDWSGFYIGVNAGGSIGRVPTQTSVDNIIIGAFNISPAGFIGGGQIGYNYQITPHLLVGVEGDLQGASQKDLSCLDDACPAGVRVPSRRNRNSNGLRPLGREWGSRKATGSGT